MGDFQENLSLSTFKEAKSAIIKYLLDHEQDIIVGINDFRDLLPVFLWIIKRHPDKRAEK